MKIILKRATVNDIVIADLVKESTSDPFLGHIAADKKLTDITGMYVDGKAVGFAIPRRDSDGKYRTGAIYITPSQRQQGYAKEFLMTYFKDRQGRAYIEPTNVPSQKLFASVGFKKSGKQLQVGKVIFDEWLLLSTPISMRW